MSSDNGNGNGQIIEADFTQLSRSESQTRGECDMQVATARRFPRSIKRFKEHALSLATLDEETAASCFYTLARGGKPIEGPSARLAEIVAASWGNIRSQACVVEVDNKFVTARGTCWDLENNTAVSVEVQRRITDKNGRTYKDDMIGVTANAACSIALRNAVFKVVPMAMVKPIYEAARRVAIGDAQTLNARRSKAIDHFGKMGVKQEQILAKLERESVEDVTLDDLAILIGLSTAIKDGDSTVDEAFPVESAKDKPTGSKSDQMAAKLKKTDDTKSDDKPAEKTSSFQQCRTALESSGCEVIESDPETGVIKFKLPNGEPLSIGDGATGQSVVDTTDPDALAQVTNEISHASKKR